MLVFNLQKAQNTSMNKTQKQLDQDFSIFGAKALEWRRKCELLLPEIDRHQVWKACGFSCIYEYAAKKAGLSRDKVNECLRILKKIEDKPALQVIAQQKGVMAIQPVATIATPETEKFWAEKANEMSKHTLETFVREIRQQDLPGEVKAQVNLNINPKLAKKLDQIQKRADFEELLEKFVDSITEKAPEPVKTASRHIPVHIKTHVINKTNGKCAFPGCQKPYKILHHTQRFALEKIHDPDRLIPLCKAHEELAHLGLIENEEGPTETWKIRKLPNKNSYKFYVDEMVNITKHNAIAAPP